MSNIRAITGSTKIMNRPTHGGSKKQGIPSSTNLNTWAHVAFRNRNVVCPCNRHVIFCMNQLGGVGAGGVPGNSYMFAPNADGVNKNKILCGINHKNIKHPSQLKLLYKADYIIFHISLNHPPGNLAYIEFYNINIIVSITTYINDHYFSGMFHLINGHGKITDPNDLIGKEYIIIGYYRERRNYINPTLTTLHFKLIEYNGKKTKYPYYNIEWLGKKAQFDYNGYNFYIIKELYLIN